MSTEGEQEFGEGEKFAEAELGENFAEAQLGENLAEAKLGENFAEAVGEAEIVAMGENGDVSSPAPQVGAASSEPRLLWSAYKSFHSVKCRLNSPAVKASICVWHSSVMCGSMQGSFGL